MSPALLRLTDRVNTPSITKDIKDDYPIEQSKSTTSRVNLLLAVKDHGPTELQALDAERSRLQERMNQIDLEREYIQKMYDLSVEYESHVV